MNEEKENKLEKKVDFIKNYKASVCKWRYEKKINKCIKKLENNVV